MLTSKPTQQTIYPEKDGIQSEYAITITRLDEGSGPFFEIAHVADTGSIQLTLEELEALTEAARGMA